MRFSPYHLTTDPNIVVDGSGNDHTVLTLSHWPKSGTPEALKADTSAEIAFRYLGSPEHHVACDVVTNNHFDQDGLVGVFIVMDPATAIRYRDLLIDVASAGDFGVFRSRDAVRISFAISSLADPETSTFPKRIFSLPYPEMAAELYTRMLPLLPELLTDLRRFEPLWETEDAKLRESEELLENGSITIEEQRDLDLAVVRIPSDLAASRVHRFAFSATSECHPLAIFNRTPCARILLMQGQRVEFQYRYESWVQFVSRSLAPRIDLTPLAEELNLEEGSGGRWTFDGVSEITPRFYLDGAHGSSIPADEVRRRIERRLKTGPPAWDPYDPPKTRC